MPDTTRQLSANDEALELIKQAEAKTGDRFMFKIECQAPGMGMPDTIARFDDGKMDHLVAPETWLSQLGGGGARYIIDVSSYESKEPIAILTFKFKDGTPHSVDPGIVKSQGWKGPKSMLYPIPSIAPQSFAGATVPPAPYPAEASPWGARVLPGFPAPGNGASGGFDPDYAARWERIRSADADLERRRLLFADQERRITEKERELEIAKMKAEHDREFAELKAQIHAPKHDSEFEKRLAEIERRAMEDRQNWEKKLADKERELEFERMESRHQRELDAIKDQIKEKNRIDPATKELLDELRRNRDKETNAAPLKMMAEMQTFQMGMFKQQMDLMKLRKEIDKGDDEDPKIAFVHELIEGGKALFESLGKNRPAPTGPMPASQQTIPAQATATNVVDEVCAMVVAKRQPADVAARILQAVKSNDPVIQDLIANKNGDLMAVMAPRIGMQIMADQAFYGEWFGKFSEEMAKQFAASGMTVAPETPAAAEPAKPAEPATPIPTPTAKA